MSDPETVNDSDDRAVDESAESPVEASTEDPTEDSIDLDRVTADFDRIEAALANLDPTAPPNAPSGDH